MAKVNAPLHSLTAIGAIGRTIIYQRGIRSNIATKWHKPGGQPTTAQMSQRSAYQTAKDAWNLLTTGEKASWQQIAKTKQISAYNAYLSATLLSPPPPSGTAWDGGATIWDGGAAIWI